MSSVKKYFALLNLLLLTGVVYYGVGIFYTVTTSKIDPTRTTPTAVAPGLTESRSAASPYEHYRPIMARDLFHTAKTVGQKAAIDIDALKPTELKVKLWGTVADENPDRAYAVVEDLQSRQQGLYRPGDTIQAATVKLILREKVILNVDGKDEVLEIASAVSSAAPVKKRARRTAPGRKIALRRALINAATSDIGNLMNQVKIEPALEKGQPAGLRVMDIKPGSIFRRMGLRNGDILTAVAGAPVQSVQDMATLYESLKNASRVEVQVKRRNRLQTITYNIQ
jgi:general secretion pathway protein C